MNFPWNDSRYGVDAGTCANCGHDKNQPARDTCRDAESHVSRGLTRHVDFSTPGFVPPVNEEGPSDEVLNLEFAYTPHSDSCKDLFSPEMYCRRQRGHSGVHAAGFGGGRRRWVA